MVQCHLQIHRVGGLHDPGGSDVELVEKLVVIADVRSVVARAGGRQLVDGDRVRNELADLDVLRGGRLRVEHRKGALVESDRVCVRIKRVVDSTRDDDAIELFQAAGVRLEFDRRVLDDPRVNI